MNLNEDKEEAKVNSISQEQQPNLNSEEKTINIQENFNQKFKCNHYSSACEIQAPCCKLWYHCRFCHDEQYKGIKKNWCEIQMLDRYLINNIRCLQCHYEQKPSNICNSCNLQFANYYCDICHIYDSSNRDIFHCDYCKICRVGIKQNVFHCQKCNGCFDIKQKSNHKNCIENALLSDCPICLENLFYSTKSAIVLERCQHFIHQKCFTDYLKQGGLNCPICNSAIDKEDSNYIKIIDELVQKSQEYLPKEFQRKCKIICNYCHKKSENIQFNPYGIIISQNTYYLQLKGMKCAQCGSYNTKE